MWSTRFRPLRHMLHPFSTHRSPWRSTAPPCIQRHLKCPSRVNQPRAAYATFFSTHRSPWIPLTLCSRPDTLHVPAGSAVPCAASDSARSAYGLGRPPGVRIEGPRRPPYKCEECPRTFEVKDLLTLHAASHVQQRVRR